MFSEIGVLGNTLRELVRVVRERFDSWSCVLQEFTCKSFLISRPICFLVWGFVEQAVTEISS